MRPDHQGGGASQHSAAVAGGYGLREVKIMVLIMRDHYRIVAPADRGEA